MSNNLYAKWAKLDRWPIREALFMLIDYNVDFTTAEQVAERMYKDDDNPVYHDTITEREYLFDQYCDQLRLDVESNKISFEVLGSSSGLYFDPVSGEEYSIEVSHVSPVKLLQWAVLKDLDIPDEFKMLLPDYDELAEVNRQKINDDEFEAKYPSFKDLNIKNPDKTALQELKQKYGILRDEANKWKVALPIAVKTGWLYYEKGLDKQASEKAFLNMFRQEFSSVLKNDVLAKQLYHHLPKRATKSSGEPQHTDLDINNMIKAAVLAGSMVDAREKMNLKSLKKSLSVESYTIPPDDILQKIITATMNLEREDDE